MQLLPLLLSLSVLCQAAPTRWNGPVISDDDMLMERPGSVTFRVVHTSHFTNAIVTKMTHTASDVQSFFRDCFRGAVADYSGEVVTVSNGFKQTPLMVGSSVKGWYHGHGGHGHGHNKHHISLLGFRNRLAVFILAFSATLAVAASYIRRTQRSSLQLPQKDSRREHFSEKASTPTPRSEV